MQDYLPAIINALSQAALVIDGNRRILLVNAAAEERFGTGLAGQDFVRALRHPDCLQAIDEVLRGAPKSKAVISVETPARATFDVTVASLGTDNPDGVRALVSIADISHVREAEQMRSDFVANVSHELRSPLTALSGFVETLKGAAKDDPAARTRFLDLMEHEAQRMIRLIADLLSLSKVEVNERLRPAGTANLSAIVERVTATLAEQANQERKTIRLIKPDDVVRVPGDDDELTQVFQNLIENAIKYGAADTDITITITPRDHVGGIRGPALAVEVRDEGDGIAPAHIPRLTERFYRVDDSRSRDKGGTGLGLAIVKHIVNRHRGRLQIKSEPGTGSSFTVVLPANLKTV
ncbi:MAG: ATP-binding protein [Aestuariivirgaceae bacterium]